MVRKVIKTQATTPLAKGLLLQGLCDVLITRSWMWDHGMTADRRCPCGQEDSPDHLIKGCSFAAKGRADRNTSEGTWKEFRQALVYKVRPKCDPGPEDYECWIKGEVDDFKDFWWDPDVPVFTDGSALHGLYPGLEVASIGHSSSAETG